MADCIYRVRELFKLFSCFGKRGMEAFTIRIGRAHFTYIYKNKKESKLKERADIDCGRRKEEPPYKSGIK
jgi:hypothetical protein